VSFLRADVRDKHEKRCDEGYTDDFEGDRPVSVRHARSRLACDSCRKRKLRCDDVTPCRSCVSKGIVCTTSSTSRRPGRPRNDSFASPVPDSSQLIDNPGADTQPTAYGLDHDMLIDPPPPLSVPQPTSFENGPDSFNTPGFPEFDIFGMNEQANFDFMNGLWQLPTMVRNSGSFTIRRLTLF
jgi:hypothetical protein